jgi:hypothetical protein
MDVLGLLDEGIDDLIEAFRIFGLLGLLCLFFLAPLLGVLAFPVGAAVERGLLTGLLDDGCDGDEELIESWIAEEGFAVLLVVSVAHESYYVPVLWVLHIALRVGGRSLYREGFHSEELIGREFTPSDLFNRVWLLFRGEAFLDRAENPAALHDIAIDEIIGHEVLATNGSAASLPDDF